MKDEGEIEGPKEGGPPRESESADRGERRRFPRYQIAGVRGRAILRHDFVVLQLSRGGMLVASDFEPKLGQPIDLDLTLGGQTFNPHGKVVFVGEDRRAPAARRYRVGVAFADLLESDQALIEGYIEQAVES